MIAVMRTRAALSRDRSKQPSELRFVDVAQHDQRQQQQHAGVRVAGTSQVLAQRVGSVAGIIHQHRHKRDATLHDRGHDDEQNSRKTL
jgi:hypothetical protein